MRKNNAQLFEQFERVIDEFFDELLIDPWRCGTGEGFEPAEVINHRDHFEVRVATRGVDAAKIEVESLGQSLTVRAPLGNRNIESSFTFPEAVDAEAVTARWSNDLLTIILPKQKVRRIALK
ncbi:MAG TPA: Hsp20 family protein [Candidatus Binataceae bacterium]|nr:Hsp20 family protein [Candidatus Binataceae bacterium]